MIRNFHKNSIAKPMAFTVFARVAGIIFVLFGLATMALSASARVTGLKLEPSIAMTQIVTFSSKQILVKMDMTRHKKPGMDCKGACASTCPAFSCIVFILAQGHGLGEQRVNLNRIGVVSFNTRYSGASGDHFHPPRV